MSENTKNTNTAPEQAQKSLRIKVDDGGVRVPIENKLGEEIGVFYFRPTDMGMIDRYNEMVEEFDNITAPLEGVNIKSDGTVDKNNDVAMNAMKEAKLRLYAACDKLFGGNMSEAFFGKMHPFSPVNGRFYCENALEALGNLISQQFERETKKLKPRIEKYTHGYAARTGKHKNGRR